MLTDYIDAICSECKVLQDCMHTWKRVNLSVYLFDLGTQTIVCNIHRLIYMIVIKTLSVIDFYCCISKIQSVKTVGRIAERSTFNSCFTGIQKNLIRTREWIGSQ